MLSSSALYDRLKIDEGYKKVAYKDSLGNWTIGIGHKLFPPTRDWTGFQANSEQIYEWFLADLNAAIVALRTKYFWFHLLDDVRQSVLVLMMFNLGPTKFAKFVNMISCLEKGNLHGAANEMEDSLWERQVKQRADMYAEIMMTGIWPATETNTSVTSDE